MIILSLFFSMFVVVVDVVVKQLQSWLPPVRKWKLNVFDGVLWCQTIQTISQHARKQKHRYFPTNIVQTHWHVKNWNAIQTWLNNSKTVIFRWHLHSILFFFSITHASRFFFVNDCRRKETHHKTQSLHCPKLHYHNTISTKLCTCLINAKLH